MISRRRELKTCTYKDNVGQGPGTVGTQHDFKSTGSGVMLEHGRLSGLEGVA